ncbi:MAG: CHAT domain-containing protein [bacterium]
MHVNYFDGKQQFLLRNSVAGILLLFFFAGCGADSTPALKQRAAAVFEKAKTALVRGDHRESRRLLREVAAIDEILGNTVRRGETSLLLAENYSAGGHFDSAFIWYETARILYNKNNDKSGVRATVIAAAKAYHLCENDEKANALLSEAIRLDKALGQDAGSRELQQMQVPVLRAIGDIDGEKNVLKELVDAYNDSDPAQRARVEIESGCSAMFYGKPDQALQKFLTSYSFAEKVNDSLLAIEALMHAGIVYDKLGKTQDAFKVFTDALQSSDKLKSAAAFQLEILVRVGNIYLRQRQFEDAHKFLNFALRSAIKSQNRLIEAYALLQLGHCMKGLSNPEAERNYLAGAALLAATEIPWANAYAHMCLGNWNLEQNQLGAALEYFRNAAACADSSLAGRDDADIFADCEDSPQRQLAPYDALIDLLMQLGKKDEGLFYAEKKNRLAAFRAFGSLGIKTRRQDLNEAFERFSRVRGNYIGAENQLQSAFTTHPDVRPLAVDIQRSLTSSSVRMQDLGDSIAQANKLYREAVLLSAPTLQEVQRIVPAECTLVEYVPASRALHTFLISSSTSSVQVSSIEKSELISNIHEFNAKLRERNRNAASDKSLPDKRMKELSSKLYGIFLRPLESRVAEGSQVLIVLPPEFGFVPLHVLQKGGEGTPYAIEQYSIRYVSDAGVLMLKDSQLKRLSTIIAFGNQGNTGWDVEYELRDIRAYANESRMYFNRDATADILQKEKGDILQCALEVHYNDRRPSNSYFVLSDGIGYGTVRYPRLNEFFASGSYPVVVFSNLSSVELSPLVPRIFRMNGSADVIANSYAPLRKTKKYFNELFYTGLIAGKNVEAAYRNVLLEMIKDKEYKAPYIWAPFFLW